jgi:hypothetical protein
MNENSIKEESKYQKYPCQTVELKDIVTKQIEKINKMPFSELRSLPICQYNYKKLYDEALNLCIQSAKQKVISNKVTIKKIQFQIDYKTYYGSILVIITSDNEWEASKATELNCSGTQKWVGERVNTMMDFEYKYAIKDISKNTFKWENGLNRKVPINELLVLLSSNKYSYELATRKSIECQIYGKSYKFDFNNGLLGITDCWQA